jgi:hypothetical protein
VHAGQLRQAHGAPHGAAVRSLRGCAALTRGVRHLALPARTAGVRRSLLKQSLGGALTLPQAAARDYDTVAMRQRRPSRPAPDRAAAARPAANDLLRRSKELTSALMACTSGEEVLSLVAASLSGHQDAVPLNAIHVSAALMRLAKCRQPTRGYAEDARFTQLLSTAETLLDVMQPQSLSNALYACGKLDVALPDSWLSRYWAASRAALPQFIPQHFSNTLYACGQLALVPPSDWLLHFWQASKASLPQFNQQELSNTLYACGQLALVPPSDWLLRFWQASQPALAQFKPQELSNTLYACSQLTLVPPPEWLQRFWQASEAALPHFVPQALSNTLYACGQLALVPPSDWLLRFWQSSQAALPQFIPQTLSNTLYACGQLALVPPSDWLLRFWQASEAALPHFVLQALSNTLYACGQLALVPPTDWLLRFWQASQAALPEFNPQHFSNTLYACSQLALVPPSDWLLCFWQASQAALPEFNPQTLSNTLYACGQLAVVPPPDWMRHYWAVCKTRLEHFNSQGCSNILLHVVILSVWDCPVLDALWLKVNADVASAKSPKRSLHARQLYQLYLVAAAEQPGLLAAPSPEVLEFARCEWRKQALSPSFSSSVLHKAVSACLTELGIAHVNKRWCERSELSIDIAIETGTHPIALEVDGPHHFLNDGQPDGPTRLRNRCLAVAGWRVVVVDYREWNRRRTAQQRAAYLDDLLAVPDAQ